MFEKKCFVKTKVNEINPGYKSVEKYLSRIDEDIRVAKEEAWASQLKKEKLIFALSTLVLCFWLLETRIFYANSWFLVGAGGSCLFTLAK